MVKRKWTGDPSCVFCPCPEKIDHLFFQCHIVKCVWEWWGNVYALTPIFQPIFLNVKLGSKSCFQGGYARYIILVLPQFVG
jgi:hypothetical protein